METHIGRPTGCPPRRDQATQIVSDKADAVAIQQMAHLIVVPAAVPKLDDMLEVGGEP